MKDQKKDKFESFLRQSLQTYGEDPSDRVWESLEQNIPQPESKRKPFLGFFLLLAMLLLFMGGYWWKYDSDIKNVQQTIQQQESQLKTITKEVEKLNNNFQESKSKNSATINNSKSFENNLRSKVETNTNKTKQSIYKSENQNQLTGKTNSGNQNSNNKNNNDLIEKKKIDLPNFIINEKTIPQISLPLSREQNKLSQKSKVLPSGVVGEGMEIRQLVMPPLSLKEIDFVPSILGKLKTKERPLNPIDLVDLIGPKFYPSFEIFNYIGTTYPNITFQVPNDKSNKRDARNFDFGLVYNIPLNHRWELQIGMGYTKRSIGTTFEKSLIYNTESLVNSNLYQSKNTFQIETNYGRQILTNYFTNTKMNDGLDIETGDTYSASISIVRNQEYVNVPLLLKYKWSNLDKKLIWTLKTGVIDRIHFSVNDPGEVSFSQFSHPRLAHNNSEIENLVQGNIASRFGLEIVLGAGLEYKVHKNFSFSIEPMFKTNIWERTDVNPYTIGIYSGLKWTFER